MNDPKINDIRSRLNLVKGNIWTPRVNLTEETYSVYCKNTDTLICDNIRNGYNLRFIVKSTLDITYLLSRLDELNGLLYEIKNTCVTEFASDKEYAEHVRWLAEGKPAE